MDFTMKTHKSIIVLLVFFSIISLQYAQAQNSLIVKLIDGSEMKTLLSTLDKITFSGGNIVLKKKDASPGIFLISDIEKMSFGVYDAVPDVLNDENSPAIYPNPATNSIRLKNPPEGQVSIAVLGLDGTVLMIKTLTDGTQQIDISQLVSGFYLLKANNITMKFAKK